MPAKTPSSRKAAGNETSAKSRASFGANFRGARQKAQLRETDVARWSIPACSRCRWLYFDAVARSMARVV
jgi:hypothetical protein